MTIEEARLPRKIVQLISVGRGGYDQLFCLCDDGTAWKWSGEAGPDFRWVHLPKPGLPALSEATKP
jgi:hypothetical protein